MASLASWELDRGINKYFWWDWLKASVGGIYNCGQHQINNKNSCCKSWSPTRLGQSGQRLDNGDPNQRYKLSEVPWRNFLNLGSICLLGENYKSIKPNSTKPMLSPFVAMSSEPLPDGTAHCNLHFCRRGLYVAMHNCKDVAKLWLKTRQVPLKVNCA